MFSTFRIKKWIVGMIVVIGTVGLVAAIERQHENRLCRAITIELDEGKSTDHFVTINEIKALITNSGTTPIIGERLDKIDLKALEARVRSNRLVQECQIATDLKGTLNVRIRQHTPIARLIDRRGAGGAGDGYFNDKGQLLPLSDHYTARTLLVSGPYFDRLTDLTGERQTALLALLRTITSDAFWKAQIAQVIVERDGEITLLPEVGNNTIVFGQPVDAEAKFRKLKLFYQKIVPLKGWEYYSQINVKFKNQLVCQPRESLHSEPAVTHQNN